MRTKDKILTVYEHECLRVGDGRLSVQQLESLQRFYGAKGVPYFSLIHNGIKFCEYVGVLQVGDTLIEVLPKADKKVKSLEDKNRWRNLLIGMIKSVGSFEVQAPSSSDLKLKSNTILDLYFEIFICEVEYLLRTGLVKKYRRREGNSFALKGSLQFGKHISKNLIHQERFYVKYPTYDTVHTLHQILYKAIKLLKEINTCPDLQSKIGALLLNFPEMPDIKVNESIFKKITLNRKTSGYSKAINIAKLLLLRYHPDITRGRENILALMLDMNKLWEQFVFVTIKNKYSEKGTEVSAQTHKYFWESEQKSRSQIIPDIVINKNRDNCAVLDTKWKNLNGAKPSSEDLHQLFVYSQYFKATKVALIYPGDEDYLSKGYYLRQLEPGEKLSTNRDKNSCSLISLAVKDDIRTWQKKIFEQVDGWYSSAQS